MNVAPQDWQFSQTYEGSHFQLYYKEYIGDSLHKFESSFYKLQECYVIFFAVITHHMSK